MPGTMMPAMPAEIRRCCLVPFFAFLCAFTAWAQTDGVITFSFLQPGTCSLSVSATGFRTLEVPSVNVTETAADRR